MQQKYRNYLNKVDSNTDLLLKRYKELIELSLITQEPQDPEELEDEEERGNTNLNVIASKALSLESNASIIIKLLEELLNITKSLKETWILNRLPNAIGEFKLHYNEATISSYEQRNEVLQGMIGELIYRISHVEDD